MDMWGETGVASNKYTEATVSETEMKKGKMSFAQAYHLGLVNTFSSRTYNIVGATILTNGIEFSIHKPG